MSLQRNLGLAVFTLTIVVISVATATTYGFSAKEAHDAKKRRRVEKLPVKGSLIEVLADDNPRKSERPIADVIAVHGLGSKYPKTWMKEDTMWLEDFLPDDLPHARILAFIYPSEAFGDPDFVDLRALGGSLLRSLVKDRGGLNSKRDRPLIFIGHSFGGLVIKQALALSRVPNPFVEGDHSYITDATCGVLFLGTPHFGSQYAVKGLLMAWALGMYSGTYNGLLKTLRLLSPELQRLNQDFLAIPAIRKLPERSLVCFYETKGMFFGPVVEEDSACLSIATRVSLNVNHKDMNKFSDREGPYDDVKYCLQRIYDPLVESSLQKGNENHYVFVVKTSAPEFELSDYYPDELWSNERELLCLSMGGSGTSGCLVFQNKTSGEKVAATFGVHNWEPWVDLATNLGDETAQEIRDSYYGGKRSVWSACNGSRYKSKPLKMARSAAVMFDEVPGKKRYPSEVVVNLK